MEHLSESFRKLAKPQSRFRTLPSPSWLLPAPRAKFQLLGGSVQVTVGLLILGTLFLLIFGRLFINWWTGYV